MVNLQLEWPQLPMLLGIGWDGISLGRDRRGGVLFAARMVAITACACWEVSGFVLRLIYFYVECMHDNCSHQHRQSESVKSRSLSSSSSSFTV